MTSNYIDLRIAERLTDREFRKEWFRSELEAVVPNLFRNLRERRELTQSELAAAANMKQSAISRFEGSSDAKWKLDTLLALAEALDARLFIGLEASEDVLARVAREERHSTAQKSLTAVSAGAAENLNRINMSAQSQNTTAKLPQLENRKNYESRPWNS